MLSNIAELPNGAPVAVVIRAVAFTPSSFVIGDFTVQWRVDGPYDAGILGWFAAVYACDRYGDGPLFVTNSTVDDTGLQCVRVAHVVVQCVPHAPTLQCVHYCPVVCVVIHESRFCCCAVFLWQTRCPCTFWAVLALRRSLPACATPSLSRHGTTLASARSPT